MMQPKRTKFRKQMKGRNRGLAERGSKVSFGEFGLKALGRGRSRQCSSKECALHPGRRWASESEAVETRSARPRTKRVNEDFVFMALANLVLQSQPARNFC